MKIHSTGLKGVVVIEPEIFSDAQNRAGEFHRSATGFASHGTLN
jgi:hypothetical protein